MRLGLRADGWLERLAGWFNLAPQPLAHAFFGMMAARSLMAGERLGLYGLLAREGPLAAEALAARAGLDPAGAAALCEALAALEVLRRERDGRWSLEPRARPWLDPASPKCVGAFLAFNYAQWDWWGGLEERLQRGAPVDLHALPPDDPRWADYMRGLYQLGRIAAPEVIRHVPLPRGARRVLDLGGGHGGYAAELCRQHPGVHVTVLDLEGSARVGRELVAREGLADRVAFRVGDATRDDLGGPWDAVLVFQVLHHLTPEGCVALLARVRRALAPGGTLAVLEYLREPEARRVPQSSALVGLHYFLTSGSAAWSPERLRGFLAQAGFAWAHARALRRLPLQTLVVARPVA